ncbi:hypothetical protein CPB86DRAFT_701979 [Serendipita vermifera]|nr:hypothetical protein CPB86DRAFT_701979 [Serendipita vermifera]
MLRDQLLQSSSLNAALLKNHGNEVSYLFTSQEARFQDLDSVFSLAHNGFQLLATSSKQLANFKTPLLSPAAKLIDRTRLSKEENEDLDRTIEALLFAISPFLTEQGASKIIEWLVRRFRVHEFNVDALLTVFLPFHCTPHFVKLVSLLHILENSVWSFLQLHQKALTQLPFEKLVQEMRSKPALAKRIFGLLGKYAEKRSEHRAAIGFYLKVNLHYLSEIKLDNQLTGSILSSVLVLIPTVESVDAAAAYLLLLSQLSNQVKLHTDALESILVSIAHLKPSIEPSYLLFSISLILRHQEEIKSFPVVLVRYLEAIPDITDRLMEPNDWIFHESFLQPLVSMLCTWPKRDLGSLLLSHLVQSKHFNRDACVVISGTMLHSYCTASADDRECFVPVFQHINEKYPGILHQVIETSRRTRYAYSTALSGMSRQEQPDGVETSLEAGFLLVANTEPSSRADGIHMILEAYQTADTEIKPSLSRRLHDLVLLTMEDTNAEVLRALYVGITGLKVHVTNEEMMLKLESVLRSQVTDISAEALSAHASILEAIVTDHDKKTGRVGKLLFPFLIFTKSQCRRTASLWKTIQQSTLGDEALLKGCDQLFPQLDWKILKGNTETLASYNETLVSTMTSNAMKSPSYEDIIEFLLQRAEINSRSSTRLLALILLHSLLDAVNGKRKFELGIRLIHLLSNDTTGMLCFNQRSLIDEMDSQRIDYVKVVTKSEHQSTFFRCACAIVLLISIAPRPSATPVVWVPSTSQEAIDYYISNLKKDDSPAVTTWDSINPANQSVQLFRTLYVLLNNGRTAQLLSTAAMRNLFVTIQNGIFLFLASIWLDGSLETGIRLASLKHGEAFIRASLIPEQNTPKYDLQIIFPFLLAALDDQNQTVRQAASSCIKHLAIIRYENGAQPPQIYALEDLPVHISGNMKLLEWPIFLKYVRDIAVKLEGFDHDTNTLKFLHGSLLQSFPHEPTKEYSITNVVDSSKLVVTAGMIGELANGGSDPLLSIVNVYQQRAYISALLSAFRWAEEATIDSPPYYPLQSLIKLVQKASTSPEGHESFQAVPLVLTDLSRFLNFHQKKHICETLLEDEDLSKHAYLSQLFVTLLDDENVSISLLEMSQPSSRRNNSGSSPPIESSWLSQLPVICDGLKAVTSPKSTALLSVLLDRLDDLVNTKDPESADIVFAQQCIMETVLYLAQSSLVSIPIWKQLQIDVLVKLIQDSSNPHIVHRALSLIASLAPLSTDSILHHLMPIVISTGSFLSPRDDIYSVKIGEKTLDSVVPILISHLRSQYPRKEDLLMAVRPYLEVFVDAALSIPSHRRLRFFLHLISSFGTAEFVVPVCLLLLEIDTVPDSNNRRHESRGDLAVQILRSQSFEFRMARISDLLETLVPELSSHPPEYSTVIASLRSACMVIIGIHIRIVNIINLVDKVLQLSKDTTQPESTEVSQRILSALLRLLANANSRPSMTESQSLRERLVATLSNALRVVSAPTMISTCIQLLRTHDTNLQIELYKLMASRVHEADFQVRESLTADILLIIVNIKEILATSQDGDLSTAALMALASLARSSCTAELSTLTDVVPVVIDKLLTSPRASIGALESLSLALGPRIIPQISGLIHGCCSNRLESLDAEDVVAIISLLRILLESTSAFWTPTDSQYLLSFCINSDRIIRPSRASNSLGKLASKKLPTSILITAIINLWRSRKENLFAGTEANEQLFILLRQVIKAGDRTYLIAESRHLLQLFLDAWNEQEKVSIADRAPSIQTFLELVVKLSETSFKPLYRIFFDWAWYIGDGHDGFYDFRAQAFCQAMKSLTGLLKGLVTPYMSTLLDISPEILSRWAGTTRFTNFELWRSFLQLLVQTTTIGDSGLWRDEHIRKLIPSLVQQIRFIAAWQRPWMLDLLCELFGAVGTVISDITLLRALLIETLMTTREDNAVMQKCALECAHSLWLANSYRAASWKVEIIPFLHECAEAENDEVAAIARRIKDSMDNK